MPQSLKVVLSKRQLLAELRRRAECHFECRLGDGCVVLISQTRSCLWLDVYSTPALGSLPILLDVSRVLGFQTSEVMSLARGAEGPLHSFQALLQGGIRVRTERLSQFLLAGGMAEPGRFRRVRPSRAFTLKVGID